MNTALKVDEHNSDHIIAGAISGFVTRFTCQPLDVIKIRFQVKNIYNISNIVCVHYFLKVLYYCSCKLNLSLIIIVVNIVL